MIRIPERIAAEVSQKLQDVGAIGRDSPAALRIRAGAPRREKVVHRLPWSEDVLLHLQTLALPDCASVRLEPLDGSGRPIPGTHVPYLPPTAADPLAVDGWTDDDEPAAPVQVIEPDASRTLPPATPTPGTSIMVDQRQVQLPRPHAPLDVALVKAQVATEQEKYRQDSATVSHLTGAMVEMSKGMVELARSVVGELATTRQELASALNAAAKQREEAAAVMGLYAAGRGDEDRQPSAAMVLADVLKTANFGPLGEAIGLYLTAKAAAAVPAGPLPPDVPPPAPAKVDP